MESALAVPGTPGLAGASQTPAAETGPKLAQESFPQKMREIAKRELNYLGVVFGLCEPMPLKRK